MEVALSANATAVGGPPGGKLILKNLKEGEREREKKKTWGQKNCMHYFWKRYKDVRFILETFAWSIIQLMYPDHSISTSCLWKQEFVDQYNRNLAYIMYQIS